jgi:hypothetical protein
MEKTVLKKKKSIQDVKNVPGWQAKGKFKLKLELDLPPRSVIPKMDLVPPTLKGENNSGSRELSGLLFTPSRRHCGVLQERG